MRKQVMFHHRKEHEKKDSAVLTDEQMSNGWRVFLMIRANVRNKVGSWWGLFRTKQNQNEGRRPRKKKNWHPTLGNHEKQQWPRPCLTSPFLKTKKNNKEKNGAKPNREQNQKKWCRGWCQVRQLTCSSRMSKISFPSSSSMPWIPFIERAVSTSRKCRKLSCHILSEWRFPEKRENGKQKGGGR